MIVLILSTAIEFGTNLLYIGIPRHRCRATTKRGAENRPAEEALHGAAEPGGLETWRGARTPAGLQEAGGRTERYERV